MKFLAMIAKHFSAAGWQAQKVVWVCNECKKQEDDWIPFNYWHDIANHVLFIEFIKHPPRSQAADAIIQHLADEWLKLHHQ